MLFLIIGVVLVVYFGFLLIRQIKSKQWKIMRLSAVIVAIGLTSAITGFIMISSPANDPDSAKITLQEYNQIKEGMTYNEVVEITGSPGDKSDLEGEEDESLAAYVFEGNAGDTSYAQLFFKDDKLLIKSQMSLE